MYWEPPPRRSSSSATGWRLTGDNPTVALILILTLDLCSIPFSTTPTSLTFQPRAFIFLAPTLYLPSTHPPSFLPTNTGNPAPGCGGVGSCDSSGEGGCGIKGCRATYTPYACPICMPDMHVPTDVHTLHRLCGRCNAARSMADILFLIYTPPPLH